MEATGANIRRLIKGSGYSVKDIMAITGISTEQAVYKWYRGESIPAIETMLILCSALGIAINELLVIDGDFAFFDTEIVHLFQNLFSTKLLTSCAKAVVGWEGPFFCSYNKRKSFSYGIVFLVSHTKT